MKRTFIILASLLFLSFIMLADKPLWVWKNNFNARILSITYHDNYLYTCAIFSDSSFIYGNVNIPITDHRDVLVMKWDTSGNIIWARNIFGSLDEFASDIKVNNADEIVVCGYTTSPGINVAGNVLTNNGGADIFIAKYDLNGNYLSANIYGTAGNEWPSDICIDYTNAIYISQWNNISKYSNAGAFVWQRTMPASQITYSTIDSTIVVSGSFSNTLTLNNLSITAAAPYDDAFVTKLTLNNIPLWLVDISYGWNQDYNVNACIHKQSGTIIASYTRFAQGPGIDFLNIKTITPAGVLTNQNIVTNGGMATHCYALCSYDSLFAVHIKQDGMPGNKCHIYNLFDFQLKRIYEDVATPEFDNPWYISALCFRNLNEIYTTSNGINLGRIGGGLLAAPLTLLNVHACMGTAYTLSGNITGGQEPLTYSWSPATGLNNTNTNTVSFIPQNDITYILTVTDSIGQIARDTFNIFVDTPISPQQITSQFPTFCKDSMLLFSNMPMPVQWLMYNPQQGYFQMIASPSVNRTIYSAGKYISRVSNSCGFVDDTIDVSPMVNVVANVSDDTLCLGQIVTLSGSGALNYTWTGGITDNIPFTPTVTQTYTLTGIDVNGCINTANITLNVYQPSASTTDTTICSAQSPLVWNGLGIQSSGTYLFTGVNALGCDSLCTLNLTVNPSPLIHITPGNDTTICAVADYVLTAEPGFVHYDWKLNGTSISNTSSASIHEVGSHFVSLTVTDTMGCIGADFVYIQVKPQPQPVLIYKDYTLLCSHTGTVSYQWFQDGRLLSDDDSIIHIATNGIYKVIVKNGFVCEAADSLLIDIDMLTTNAGDVSLYPNPSSGTFTINYVLTASSDVSIMLFDINGRAVHTFLKDDRQIKGFHRQFFNLDTLGIESGVYFFRIQLGLNTYVKKLLFH